MGIKASMGVESQQVVLSARGVHKRFVATHALKGVDFDLRVGEIHALIGANGAGKSTFARVMAGLLSPDSGEIRIAGELVHFAAPRDAMDAGITMVTQETSLAKDLTALENIFLPELGKSGRLNWRGLRRRARDLISDLMIDVGFSLEDEVSSLSMANRQIVEILKVLALNSHIIFLDEPTTSLSPHECDLLLELTRRLAARGHALVLVTHRMEEIFNFTDRLTVLREGNLVAANVETGAINSNELIRMMVGRELQDVYSERERPTERSSRTAFEVKNLRVGKIVKDVSFSVAEGEILGLGGLIGAGRTESVETIFGLTLRDAGEMFLYEKPFNPTQPSEAIAAGVGFVGEDRRRLGLVPDFGVFENLMLVHLGRQEGLFPHYGARERAAIRVVQELGLNPNRLRDTDILKFSGGMQQKIIIARWLLEQPRLLILDEPTRGVDIETRASIYKALRRIAAEGTAIILVSSDFEELLGISNRVTVVSDGRSVSDIPAPYLDIERLTMLAAPRSSAGQIGGVLQVLASRHHASAIWLHQDDDKVFCFESAAHPEAPISLERGGYADRRTFETEDANPGAKWLQTPVVGKRGQSLGFVRLTVSSDRALPTTEEVVRTLQESLHPISPA
jgi:ABC-type sugar transport system ATPase subunit